MTIPAWPSISYLPLADSFKRIEHHRPLVTTEVEDGPDLMRVQGQTRIERYAVSFLFEDSDYATLRTFIETTLAQGTSHFTMSVPVVGATYTTRRCYIEGGAWSDIRVGMQWQVSFTLCIFPS